MHSSSAAVAGVEEVARRWGGDRTGSYCAVGNRRRVAWVKKEEKNHRKNQNQRSEARHRAFKRCEFTGKQRRRKKKEHCTPPV